jgi:hypothetical protein
MCGSNGFNNACCPPAQILKEEICGNFNNSSGAPLAIPVWEAPAGDYIQGTFQVFNSAASVGVATGNIDLGNFSVAMTPATPGNTVSETFNNPEGLVIATGGTASGRYCITLYKRVLA